jgi:release factor glutamine methyltransferase
MAAFPHGRARLVAGQAITAEALLSWRRRLLSDGGHPADLDWLLDQSAGLAWPELQALWLHPGRLVELRVPLAEIERLWWRHRHHHIPLQYLVGTCPWRDLEIRVSPDVLIPRQETELLPDLALEAARRLPAGRPSRWADLGTGSGCLALALAHLFPDASGHAVDCSPAALAQARLNLSRAPVLDRVVLHLGSWWEVLRPWWGRLELVVSNPPYIPTGEIQGLDPVVRLHEPRLALDGGADGLGAIRAIAVEAPRALAPGGWLLLEHHHDQAEAVRFLLRSAGLQDVESRQDLEGQRRFVQARRPLHL